MTITLRHLLDTVNLTSLTNARLQHILILLYKSLFSTSHPQYMKGMFTFRSVNYNVRGTEILSLPKPQTTTYGLHSFSYLAEKLWNSLSDDIRSSATLSW